MILVPQSLTHMHLLKEFWFSYLFIFMIKFPCWSKTCICEEPDVAYFYIEVLTQEVSQSPQPLIVLGRLAKWLLKSSLRTQVLSTFYTCSTECHNYFYCISGVCTRTRRGIAPPQRLTHVHQTGKIHKYFHTYALRKFCANEFKYRVCELAF